MMTKITTPTIDEHAQAYLTLKAQLDVAKECLEEKKEELIKLARKNGAVPDGAEKSLRLEGDTHIITVSFGTSSSVNQEVIEQIKGELAEAHTPGLFKHLFREETKYLVAPTAPAVLENLSKKVRALFDKVMTTKPKEPSLKVEKKKAGGR